MIRRPPTRRARDAEAKDRRRDHLVTTAADLLEAHPYDELTIAAVARAASLAKGTVYLYFTSKEALFLALLVREAEDWFTELHRELPAAAGDEHTVTAVVSLLVTTLMARPLLRRLLARLHLTLEQNLGPSEAAAFKEWLLRELSAIGARLEAALPRHLAPGDGLRVFLYYHALVVGLQQMAQPGEAVAAVLARPELAPLRTDVAEALLHGLAALIHGFRGLRDLHRLPETPQSRR